MTNVRDVLSNRRGSVTFEFEHMGMVYTATFGFYNHKVKELFLNNAHLGSVADSMARDAAIAISIALQWGADVDDLRTAMTRNVDGSPSSPLGHALDIIVGETW